MATMDTSAIAALRSVALDVPDLVRAETFYTQVWRLHVAAREGGTLYLRGTGSDHHLLALRQGGSVPTIRHFTLRARDAAALPALAEAAVGAGGRLLSPIGPVDDPAGGTGFLATDNQGRRVQVLHGDARRSDTDNERDRPIRLAHVVLNSADVAAAQAFWFEAFGFVLADRTRIMAFLNCNHDHHSVAFADADNHALNHIAFVMPDVDAVMRGGGRMRDADHAIEWGPGRHGPGDNTFNYFIDPFGVVIEYTADVEQVDASYRPRGPAEWAWPPGRVDQWGIAPPPSARLREAQRRVHFIDSDSGAAP